MNPKLCKVICIFVLRQLSLLFRGREKTALQWHRIMRLKEGNGCWSYSALPGTCAEKSRRQHCGLYRGTVLRLCTGRTSGWGRTHEHRCAPPRCRLHSGEENIDRQVKRNVPAGPQSRQQCTQFQPCIITSSLWALYSSLSASTHHSISGYLSKFGEVGSRPETWVALLLKKAPRIQPPWRRWQ